MKEKCQKLEKEQLVACIVFRPSNKIVERFKNCEEAEEAGNKIANDINEEVFLIKVFGLNSLVCGDTIIYKKKK